MNRPLVSIITVVYNGEKTLLDTINSVANQTYKNIEYIIIDGLSTDNTLEIIRSNIKIISTLISEEDDGLYDAMNKGIGIARGDIVGIINSDDWYEPEAVEIAVNAFIKNPEVEIVHGNMNYFYNNQVSKKITPLGGMLRMKLLGMSYFHPTFFVKKSVYNGLKFNINYRILADYDFVMRCILSNKKFYYINRILANMRSGGVSASFIPRILEGHNIRIGIGMNIFYVYMSTFFRVILTIIYKIKLIINRI